MSCMRIFANASASRVLNKLTEHLVAIGEQMANMLISFAMARHPDRGKAEVSLKFSAISLQDLILLPSSLPIPYSSRFSTISGPKHVISFASRPYSNRPNSIHHRGMVNKDL